jgi:hypothetical protein
MRRKASAQPRCDRRISQLHADAGWRARPSAGRAAQHAEQGANGQTGAYGEPWLELLPGPTVHPDFATLVALAVLCRGVRNAELVLGLTAFVLLMGCRGR